MLDMRACASLARTQFPFHFRREEHDDEAHVIHAAALLPINHLGVQQHFDVIGGKW
jgi:hypothetical protein